jgi:hypothetical protein
MLTKKLFGFALIPICALWMASASAEEPRTLSWEDLAVKVSAADNPFVTLSTEQLMALSDVAGRARAKSAWRNPDAGGSRDREEGRDSAAAGWRRCRWTARQTRLDRREKACRHQRRESGARRENDRMPGYVLPLEFSGSKVTEFLLVPWVGACIHTPPPEANQIVYVKADKPFDIRRTFDAVWVTGRIAATGTKEIGANRRRIGGYRRWVFAPGERRGTLSGVGWALQGNKPGCRIAHPGLSAHAGQLFLGRRYIDAPVLVAAQQIAALKSLPDFRCRLRTLKL